jgi:hypothetical protein
VRNFWLDSLLVTIADPRAEETDIKVPYWKLHGVEHNHCRAKHAGCVILYERKRFGRSSAAISLKNFIQSAKKRN